MKFSKNCFSLLTALCFLALPAIAQNDTFSVPRQIVLAAPTVLTAAAATVTNGPIDISGYLGTANIDITTCTNAGGALTATLYESADQTNIAATTNFTVITAPTSYVYTNHAIGGIWATNNWLLPGTLTVPVSATAGFATTYLAPFSLTNTSPITVTAKGVYRVGLRAQEHQKYLYIVWTPTGSSSNDFVSAVFNGIRGSEIGTSQ
jgi:hypothetical protein